MNYLKMRAHDVQLALISSPAASSVLSNKMEKLRDAETLESTVYVYSNVCLNTSG